MSRIEGTLQEVWIVFDSESMVCGVFESEDLAREYVKLDPSEGCVVLSELSFVAQGIKDSWDRVWRIFHPPYLLQKDDPVEVARKKEQERLKASGLSKLTVAEAEALGYVKTYLWKKVMHRWTCDVAGATLVVESIKKLGDVYGDGQYEWWVEHALGRSVRIPGDSLEGSKHQVVSAWEQARYTNADLKEMAHVEPA